MTALLLPRELPDGRITWEEPGIGHRLRYGDATVGWEGDESLSLVLNVKAQRWEVWRRCPDGVARLICSARQKGVAVPGPELLRNLSRMDTRRVDVRLEVEAHNAALEKARDDEAHAQNGDIADKLAWAFGRDLDIPAQSGRPYAVAKPETP